MEFKDSYLQNDMDAVHSTEAINDVADMGRFNLELDFVEQYRDTDGVLHIKTFFDHGDIDESNLWEVFDAKDSSMSLELLLHDNI